MAGRVAAIIDGIEEMMKEESWRPLSRRFHSEHMSCYARFGKRYVNGVIENCIVIASVEVDDPTNYRKGLFRELCEETEHLMMRHEAITGILMESVLNESIIPFIEAIGYRFVKDTGIPGSPLGDYFKPRSKE